MLFFNNMIKIKDFNPDLIKIDKNSYKNIDIYYIGYIPMEDFYYVKVNSVNPLYLIFRNVEGYLVIIILIFGYYLTIIFDYI